MVSSNEGMRSAGERGMTVLEVAIAYSVLFLVVSGSLATRVGDYRDGARSTRQGVELREMAGRLEELRGRPPETPGRSELPSGETLTVTECEPGLWRLELRRGSQVLTTYLARETEP